MSVVKVKFKQSCGVANAFIECLKPIKDNVYTLTADNGSEHKLNFLIA